MTADIYARKGERVTCTNGHVIGVFARDAYRDEVFTGDMLVDWQKGIDCYDGVALGNCRFCGAPWNGSDNPLGGGYSILHIEGSWRR
jgi:hypothetical protein